MGGMVKRGPSSFVWDASHKSQEELIDELWDEVIDYMLALRAIAKAPSVTFAQRISLDVLRKYQKEEE